MVPRKEFPLFGFLLYGPGCLDTEYEKDTEKKVLTLAVRFYVAMALLALLTISLISFQAYYVRPAGSGLRNQLKECLIYPICNILLLMSPSPLFITSFSAFLYAKLLLDLSALY